MPLWTDCKSFKGDEFLCILPRIVFFTDTIIYYRYFTNMLYHKYIILYYLYCNHVYALQHFYFHKYIIVQVQDLCT